MSEVKESKSTGQDTVPFFPTTQWTALLQPIGERTPESHAALNRLFEIYRQPIVNYVRTLVRHPQQAEDIAHDFITRLLTRGDLANANKSKGRFRGYLCACIRNHVSSHYEAEDAIKRSAFNHAGSLDDMEREPGHTNDAEKEFTRQWCRAAIDEAIRRLRSEWEAAGKLALFNDLEPLLWDKSEGLSVTEIAVKHHLTANAVSIRKNRLSNRLRDVLLEVFGETVGSPSEVEEEIRRIFQDP